MSDLMKRVDQYRTMSLPGQPQSVHMGTSYLITDLVVRIRELEKAALDVCCYDWSYNDDDAVAAIDRLRKTVCGKRAEIK